MDGLVVFHLKRFWEGRDLWEEIKAGRKTSEWRDATEYWSMRLVGEPMSTLDTFGSRDIELDPLPEEAWFVVGYPKRNLPRLEAKIEKVIYHPNETQFEIQFSNVVAVNKI